MPPMKLITPAMIRRMPANVSQPPPRSVSRTGRSLPALGVGVSTLKCASLSMGGLLSRDSHPRVGRSRVRPPRLGVWPHARGRARGPSISPVSVDAPGGVSAESPAMAVVAAETYEALSGISAGDLKLLDDAMGLREPEVEDTMLDARSLALAKIAALI